MEPVDFIKLINCAKNKIENINLYFHHFQDGQDNLIFKENDPSFLTPDIKVVEDYILFVQIKIEINQIDEPKDLTLEEFGIKIYKQIINLKGEVEYKELYIKYDILLMK